MVTNRNKTSLRKVPDSVFDRFFTLGQALGVPTTKAMVFREKLINGQFKGRKINKKGRGKKEVFEIEFM